MMSTSSNEAPPSHLINFGCGHPDASLLPVHQVAAATERALLGTTTVNGAANNNNGQEWLQYGRENGNPRARKALADFLTTMYFGDGNNTTCSSDNDDDDTTSSGSSSIVVDPDTLFLTSGVSHSIQLACRTLKRLYDEQRAARIAGMQGQDNNSIEHSSNINNGAEDPLCLIEDPTYFLVPQIFQQSDFDLQPIATNPTGGLDIAAFKGTIQAVREASPDRLIVLYAIPTHHNPLGVSLCETDRTDLVKLCETYRVYLIADEVYHGLGFPIITAQSEQKEGSANTPRGAAPLLFKQMAMRSPFVISVSAFTKILCPGIRCGWIQSTDMNLVREFSRDGVLDSGGCSSQLTSGIVTELIESKALLPYMKSMQVEYARRCHHLCRLLKEASDNNNNFSFKFQMPKGGYFLWVKVAGVDFEMDEAFRLFCRKEFHVDFRTGTSCSSATWQPPTPPPPSVMPTTHQKLFSQYIRLCFAYYDTLALTQGVERLCHAIQAYSAIIKQEQLERQSSAL